MKQTPAVHLLFLSVELMLPESHSLKEKRRLIKPCIEKLKNTFNASVIEMAYMDKWQRAVIGVSMLSTDKVFLTKVVTRIEQLLLTTAEVQIVNINAEWL